MKVGIIGLPQSGKKTLFSLLTGNKIEEGMQQNKAILGTADILDPRFDTLVELYGPKKIQPARIDFSLLPKLEKESIAKGSIFKDMIDLEVICLLVRAFEDESIFHPDGKVDPVRDSESICSELLLHDQLFIEKRLERLELSLKKNKDEEQKKEAELMKKMQKHLEEEKPLRLLDLTEEEEALIKSYPLITFRQMLLLINTGEEEAGKNKIPEALIKKAEKEEIHIIGICVGLEAEIAMFETEEEKKAFLEELGIKQTALSLLTQTALEALGRISFFTVGKTEVHQWLLRKDLTAPKAAGVIHSDLERGFIRAEVIKYQDLIELGGEAEVKKAGKLQVNGKDYKIEDGDILNIRFKV